MATIITRIGYCPLCALADSPKSNQKFLVHGSSSNSFRVLQARWHGIPGMCPHIYKLDKIIGNRDVVIYKSCAMYPCGVTKTTDAQGDFYYVKEYKREVWTLECWNALVQLKNNVFTRNYEI